jgi:spermidine synthase
MKADFWFQEKVNDQVGQIVRVKRTLLSERTVYQQIDVLETDQFGRILVLDGAINVGEKDEFIYHEMLTHVPLLVHADAKALLIIGGGDGGVVREALKHSVDRIDLVEIDTRVIDISRRYFPSISRGLDDSKVSIHIDDGTRFVTGQENRYDVVIVDSTDPVGAGMALYEETFYRDVYRALTPNGVVATQTESPFFDRNIILDLYPKLRRVFPVVCMYLAPVPFYPGTYWSFAFCSKGVHPVEGFELPQGVIKRIKTRYYNEEVHRGAFIIPPCLKELVNSDQPL